MKTVLVLCHSVKQFEEWKLSEEGRRYLKSESIRVLHSRRPMIGLVISEIIELEG